MPLSTRNYSSASNSATKSLFKHRSIAGFTVVALSLSSFISPAVVAPAATEVRNQTIGAVNGSDILTNTIPGVANHVTLPPAGGASTGMNVTSRVDTADTTVEYHPTGTDQVCTTTTTETGRTNRVCQFTEPADLTPATEYEYRIITVDDASEPQDIFHTVTVAPQDFDFIYFSNAQNGLTGEAKIFAQAAYNAVPNTTLAIHTGDQINDTDDDEQWGQWFETQGPTARKMPVLTALGSHELKDGPLTKNFQNHHTYPASGSAVLPESIYYVDYQSARFITLTSNNLFLSQQARFLGEALSSSPNQWSVVMFHQPVYSVTTKWVTTTDLRYFDDILEKHNVDLVLNGHDHAYARGHRFDSEADGESIGPVYMVSSADSKFCEAEPENAVWDNNDANRKVWTKGAATCAKTSVQGYTMAIDSVVTHGGAGNHTSTSVSGAGQTMDSFAIDKCGESK